MPSSSMGCLGPHICTVPIWGRQRPSSNTGQKSVPVPARGQCQYGGHHIHVSPHFGTVPVLALGLFCAQSWHWMNLSPMWHRASMGTQCWHWTPHSRTGCLTLILTLALKYWCQNRDNFTQFQNWDCEKSQFRNWDGVRLGPNIYMVKNSASTQ